MKKKRFFPRQQQAAKPSGKPSVLIHGDAQAESIALLFRALPEIAPGYEVLYQDARGGKEIASREQVADCAFSFEQHGASAPYASRLPRNCCRISFPQLRLKLLWPLAAPNPFNRPEPQYPAGRFPWGDSFIASAVKRGISADEIMRFYETQSWHATWPNLDVLFKEESANLSATDAKSDVKIGSFILKHFRKERLFWSVNAPSNKVLAELAYRMLHAAFGPQMTIERDSVVAALAGMGGRDLMGGVALPIHPLVARHFGLEWYDAAERYASLDGVSRTFSEYYRDMIASAGTR